MLNNEKPEVPVDQRHGDPAKGETPARQGPPDKCPECGSTNVKSNGSLLISPVIDCFECLDCGAGWRETDESYQEKVKADAEAQAKTAQEAEVARILDKEKGILPLGVGIRFILAGVKPLPINRRNKIAKIGEHRTIVKDEKAESHVHELRLGLFTAYQDLCKRDAIVKATTFPIDGKKTPIRVDVFFAWSKADRAHGELKRSDLDNLAKAVLDALKFGPIQAIRGRSWGVISDDNYITELVLVKGEAPEDGQGSRIVVNVSRAGWRSPEDMAGLVNLLKPWPPWIPGWGNKILRPNTGNPIRRDGRII